jgi:hypothetical protein
MTLEELDQRLDASPALTALKRKLTDELAFRADNSVQFSPMLILMVISIALQVIRLCREENSPEEVIRRMREVRTLPPRKLMRLRRRLNAAWRDCCAEQHTNPTEPNPLVTALYELGDIIDERAAADLLELAAAH